MDGITSSTSSSSGALELIISDLNELLFRTVESFKKLMYLFEVMQNIDWTTMLLFFWIIFALFVYLFGNILFLVIKKSKNETKDNNSLSDNTQECVDDRFQKTSDNSHVFADAINNRESKFAIATGPDADCVTWINKIIQWIYSQNDTTIESILNVWLTALNNKSKKLSIDNGFSIEFVQIVREQSFPPELSNVRVNMESNENITTTSKITTTGILVVIKVFRENSSSNEQISQYQLHIERFEGLIKIVCISEESLLVIRFTERPDLKSILKPIKTQQQKSDNRISEDVIIDAILHVISTTVIDLCLSGYHKFPKFKRNAANNSMHLEGLSHNRNVERKLFVKVVKANSLGQTKGCRDPYCVIEVDDPPQRSTTTTIKDTSSPVWNEHFIFNLHKESSEILFELYDKNNSRNNDNFLGLGIVSVNELKDNPSQKQIITLQPRPLELDQVSGSLTVEFLFMEHSSSTPLSESNSLNVSPTNSAKEIADNTLIANNTIKMSQKNEEVMLILNSDPNDYTGNESCLTEVEASEEQNNSEEFSIKSLKELESKPIIPNTNKSTLTIHSTNRTSENGGSEGYGTGRVTPEDPSLTEGSLVTSANSSKSRTSRSRSKEPRSIIRAIRKRFSFNKNRSKSVEIRTDKESEPTSRDSSISSTSDRARSMPGSREPSSPKEISANKNTAASGGNGKTDSFSNLSETSGYSTRTFVHEKSTLIVEANDNGVLKHYIIPMSLANKSKWRKKGSKLHLYNDHMFVAKHLSGSITCQVCGKLFSRRPGKQGYQCRDCDYMCHKRCHIQVDVRCTKSTISSLKLESVIDPKANKLEKNNFTQVNNKPNGES